MPTPPRVPPALHEGTVAHFRARDPSTGATVPDDAIDGLASAMARARGLGEQLVALSAALAADATRTPADKAVALRKAALDLGAKAAATLDAARARASAAAEQLAAMTDTPPRPTDPLAASLEAEVRAALARMDPETRGAALAAALTSGDDRVVGAALRGPSFLAGLDTMRGEGLRHRYRLARHPAEAQRLDRLGRATAAVDRGGSALLGLVEQLASTPEARAASANQAAAAGQLAAVAEAAR